MTLYLPCECGFSLVSSNFEDLVMRALHHARRAHGMELSPEQVMTLAQAWTGEELGADVGGTGS